MSDDLLAGLDDERDAEFVDLLDEMGDSAGAPAWVPEEKGEGIQGNVLSVEYEPDKFNAEKQVPIVTLKLDNGEEARVIGFSTVLRNEIDKQNPERGDRMAVKYFGTEKIKKGAFAGKDYAVYKVAVRKK